MKKLRFDLIVLYSVNLQQTLNFYTTLGLNFNEEKHGKGPTHYACEISGIILELYPAKKPLDKSADIGFSVNNLDSILEKIAKEQIYSTPKITEYGRTATLTDPDGRRVHLRENSA